MDDKTIKGILEHVKGQSDNLQLNEKIFEILEGNLISHVEESLKAQLTGNSLNIAMQRISPINILIKIINKLSKIYSESPTRSTENPSDQGLMGDYEKELGINSLFGDYNENFNAYKGAAVEFYIEDDRIKVRNLPSHTFTVYSDDRRNPLRMTHFIKLMGEYIDAKGNVKQRVWIYSNEEFLSVLDDGTVVDEDMEENEGINPFGIIPAVYVNRSKYLLNPYPDRDLFIMAVLFPVLMTDQNFAAMFNSHSILYGVDIDCDNLKLSPDMFWNLKSDSEGKSPTVGVITPQVRIEDNLNLIKAQMIAWLDSRNVRASGFAGVSADNLASGVSLLIKEMDTTQDRKLQEQYFKDMEENDFWKKLATIHNYLATNGAIKDRRVFSSNDLEVRVEFADQKPIEERQSKVNTVVSELNARLISRSKAIKRLNPSYDEKKIAALIEEIDNDMPMVEVVTDNEETEEK